ncbi:MAG: thiamine pyrophosphate-dependent enzyme, partial [Bacteroidia bacterium]
MHQFSFLTASDAIAIEGLYQQYNNDPASVDLEWARFFEGFDFAVRDGLASVGVSSQDALQEVQVALLLEAYRSRAHLIAQTNPIRPRKDRNPGLDLATFGLSESDLSRVFSATGGKTLESALDHMRRCYGGSLGFEYQHIREKEIRDWCKNYFENRPEGYGFDLNKKKRILQKLNEAVVFEHFLHKKFVGQKRFSLEGGENTIPALDAIIQKGAELGIEAVAVGMAHRGRLNVLANILGKTYEYIFNEFEGIKDPDLSFGDGDVKYHLGFASQVQLQDGHSVHLDLVPNPSHLEAVDPVLQGFVRAKCDMLFAKDYRRILPILIHGDAALAGQGVASEVAQMSRLKGYQTGGTLHFVINNQIGFTTDFDDARSSDYCTSVALGLGCPVLHVNGDDAEAVVFAVEMAVAFRQEFGRDFYVDMLCYRRHGHNESDEPKFTQPTLYGLIENHPDPRKVYSTRLEQSGQVTADLAVEMEKSFKAMLQDRLNKVKQNAFPYALQP